MPIPVTTKADFCEHLDMLGITVGDRICVHSRLLSLGRIEGGAIMIRDALLEAVGQHGSLAVPTFTFNLTPEKIYDPLATPPHLCGPLADCVRDHPQVRRTQCPVHSYAVIGPAAEAILSADPTYPLGPGSAFDVMHREGFKLILLGCTYQEGATYVHSVEADIGVPYRHWIQFERSIRVAGGRVEEILIHYYAKQTAAFRTDLRALEREIESSGQGLFVPAKHSRRRSHTIEMKRLAVKVESMIRSDPYALVVTD